MAAASARARARSRCSSALTGAVVFTATPARGARAAASIARRAITRNVDGYAILQDNSTLAQAEAIATLPQVAVGKRLALMQLFSTQGFAVVASPIDPGFGTDLLRYRVLRGRVADPTRRRRDRALGVDGVGIRPARRRHVRVRVAVCRRSGLVSRPAHSNNSPLCRATAQAVDRDRIDLSKLQGPHARLRVVGITRNLFDGRRVVAGARSSTS